MATKTITPEEKAKLEAEMARITAAKKALKEEEDKVVKALQKDVLVRMRKEIKTFKINASQLKGVLKTRSSSKKGNAKSEEATETTA